MKPRSGGGITSNKLVQSRSPKTEPRSRAVNPAYPGQLGSHFGKHADKGDTSKTAAVPMNAGRGYSTPVGPTDNVKAVGVGGGRTVHRTGTQGTHGRGVLSETPPAASKKAAVPVVCRRAGFCYLEAAFCGHFSALSVVVLGSP